MYKSGKDTRIHENFLTEEEDFKATMVKMSGELRESKDENLNKVYSLEKRKYDMSLRKHQSEIIKLKLWSHKTPKIVKAILRKRR